MLKGEMFNLFSSENKTRVLKADISNLEERQWRILEINFIHFIKVLCFQIYFY